MSERVWLSWPGGGVDLDAITVHEVRPGTRFVARVDYDISDSVAEIIRDRLSEALGAPVTLVDRHIHLEVVQDARGATRDDV